MEIQAGSNLKAFSLSIIVIPILIVWLLILGIIVTAIKEERKRRDAPKKVTRKAGETK